MLILAGKLLLWSTFVFICFINTTTVAQPGNFLSYDCVESVNFTRNGTYERNLAANSGFGFFHLSIGQGTDRVNSIALCRGDVEPAACRICLNDSIAKLREICPNQKEAIRYYDNYMLKYSNQTILRNTQIKVYVFLANSQNASDKDRFNSLLRPLMVQLRLDAAAGVLLCKFATGNTTGRISQRFMGFISVLQIYLSWSAVLAWRKQSMGLQIMEIIVEKWEEELFYLCVTSGGRIPGIGSTSVNPKVDMFHKREKKTKNSQ
ncbi:hypothetical protein OSB04_008382 [Centaurea solstitialis]|uniref:Gnk2-homologous domain-containing protein n=1 Tax=Centaurea solstitialis TaxID=347529 RepID=A0AA38WJF1_9ASTR|nr:hypothetical protein OSB04_008382 [Centaurea solstitialis]